MQLARASSPVVVCCSLVSCLLLFLLPTGVGGETHRSAGGKEQREGCGWWSSITRHLGCNCLVRVVELVQREVRSRCQLIQVNESGGK